MAFHKNTSGKRYFTESGKPFPKESMSKVAANGEIRPDAIPLPGVCVADADVRILPTVTPLFSSAETAKGDRGLLKLDWLQNSTIKPGEPIAIFAYSKDKDWLFIASGTVVGWVRTNKTAFVDDEFMERYMYAEYAVFVKDNVKIRNKNGGAVATAKMGTILPVEGKYLLAPMRDKNGNASVTLCEPGPGEVEPFPIAFTPRNAARAMDEVLGEPYGWGGMYAFRDCSAMTRDYFSLFGVWLPRNSADQAATGAAISLKDIQVGEKLRAIVERGVPFATLIHMPGHIMLYLGVYDGEPVVMHNVWGVRVKNKNGGEGRVVIGRTVVSSLRAGEEIKGRPESSLYIDRVAKLAFPVGNIGR
jgi:hypothetical protein